MKIKFLITGGTIDKVYNELDGQLVFKETQLIDMLNRSHSMVDTLWSMDLKNTTNRTNQTIL
jgi:L-asparaginase